MLRRSKDAKEDKPNDGDDQRKLTANFKAPLRFAGLLVLLTLAAYIGGDAMKGPAAVDVAKEVVSAAAVDTEVSSATLSTLQPADVASKAISSDLFAPGKPKVTYIHMEGNIPYPTALPPPDQVMTDKDWYEPVTPLAHMTQMKELSRCALIGSHSALKGRGLGKEIDAHDVVIRVNDVLTFNDDVGHKSDIYFATMCKVRRRALGVWGTKHGPECNYFCRPGALRQRVGSVCPFRLVIMAGFNASACHSAITTEGYYHVREIAQKACYPTGMVNDAWSSEMQEIRRGRENDKKKYPYWGRPTTGFHAIVVMGYLCNSLTLYGFALDIANHTIDKRHSPEKERLLIQQMVNGTLEPEYYPPIMNKTLRPKLERGAIRFAFL